MFRPMNLRTIVGVWVAVLVAGAAFGAFAPESISISISALWLAVCVVSASMMVSLWRAAPLVTLAANLHNGRSRPRRRRSINELMRARIQRA